MITHSPFSSRQILVAAILLGTTLTSAPLAAQQLLWSDEFDEGVAPNPEVWSYDLGANGWGNQELQEYTDDLENARVENGNLVITARETVPGTSAAAFSSARLRTQDKVMFKYGTIEARIKVPNIARGLWPAFWTLGNNFSEVGWPNCGELDILEMGWRDAVSDGNANRWVSSAAHWEDANRYAYFGRTYDPSLIESFDFYEDYHTFKMNWTPNTITTYLDDREIWTMDISPGSCNDCEELHQPHFMIINLAVGGTFTGLMTPGEITAPLPGEMMVDYVRIYDNGFTELSGPGVDADPSIIGPAHSGSWYNSDQSGHGFSAEFGMSGDKPYAVIYWYIYDDAGDPIFFIGQGEPVDNRVEVTFYSPVGMVYGEFDPSAVPNPLDVAGTGVFEFSDRDNATFSYTPSQFSESTWGHTTPVENLPLTKLFGIDAEKSFPLPTPTE
jgi:beta-glucanase (GH16 family)